MVTKKKTKGEDILILSATSSNNEHVNYCDHAVIDLSLAYLHKLFAWRSQAENLENINSSFYSLHVWDSTPSWIANSDNSECSEREDLERLDELVDVGSFKVIAPSELPKSLIQMSSECCQLVITPIDFSWECYAKHTSVQQTTQSFPFEDFKRYL